jgi:branched-chain amino acid transport system substrate-binding protein
MKTTFVATAIASLALFGPARADTIHVGFTVSSTGPAASLGIPQKNSIALMPKEIGGDTIDYTILDDAGDSTKAVANMRKLIDEDHADVIIGSSVTPAALAMIDVAAEQKVPVISLGASAAIISPMDDKRKWVFKTPQNDDLMADAVVGYMAKHGVKTLAYIGFNDAYGDGWLTQTTRAAKADGVQLIDVERFARNDTSVMGQVLKVMAAHPDAVLIAGSGTPAALPETTLKDRGYTGKLFQTHGVANSDFLRVGGKALDGTVLPAGPVLVAAQLPDSNPIKQVALDYVTRYEKMYGAGSFATFGAHSYDAMLLLDQAIPVALKQARPGTQEFRAALRNALEGLHNVTLTQGISTMSATDHNGFDERARVMVEIENGTWKLLP